MANNVRIMYGVLLLGLLSVFTALFWLKDHFTPFKRYARNLSIYGITNPQKHGNFIVGLAEQHRQWLASHQHFYKLNDLHNQVIHGISTWKNDKVILFGSGLQEEMRKSNQCVFGNRTVPGEHIYYDMFQCQIGSITPMENDKVSFKLKYGSVAPSIARWHDRKGLTVEKQPKVPLCSVTIVKNESKGITDWVEYHLRQGVELFIIYDNNSTDQTKELLHSYKEVLLIDWPWKKLQVEALVHGVQYIKDVCEWALLTDVDEYFFPAQENANFTLKEFVFENKWKDAINGIDDAKEVSRLTFKRKRMGTSGYIKCPNVPVPEAYIEFYKWDNFKSIVRPKKVLPKTNVHTVSVDGKAIRVAKEVAHVVHYRFKCWEHFLTKYDKGRVSRRMKNWDKGKLEKDKEGNFKPDSSWLKARGPIDTNFRDYKRKVNKWPLSHR